MAEAAIQCATDLARHAQRSAVRIGDEHHLEVVAVMRLEQPLARAVRGDLRLDYFRAGDHEALGEPGPLRLCDVAHRREVADSAIVDPVPNLLGAKLRLLRLQPSCLERGTD